MKNLDERYSRAYERMVRLGYENDDLDIMFYDWAEGAEHWDWLYESGTDDIDKWLNVVREDIENTED